VLLHAPVAPERLDGRGAPERDGSRARVRRASPRSVRVDAELEHAGFLVVSDAFYPGWEAEVDGKPAPLLRANHAFRAVWLERGAHRVRFRYRPGPWRVGLALAAVAALALAVVAAAGRRGAPGLALLPRRGNDGSDA
jgi:uncharacterized membrane protein YfhO